MEKTIVQKILSAHSGSEAQVGDIVIVAPDAMMAHDARLAQTMATFAEMGEPRRFEGEVVLVLDHYGPPPSIQFAELHRRIRGFAGEIEATLYDVGEGICHNLMTERGHALPGRLVVGTDSHSDTYGALNCMATGIESSDFVAALVTGKMWMRVPETIRVELVGTLPPGSSAKDVTLWLLSRIGEDGAAYRVLEFCGDGYAGLSMDARFTLSNHAAELGAKAAIGPFDARTRDWLAERNLGPYTPVAPDPGAAYAEHIVCDLSTLTPQVAIPHKIDHVTAVDDLPPTHVDVGFIGSCTNARVEDLRIAAAILKDTRIAPGTRLLVNPGSKETYLEALQEGIVATLVAAGATVLPPGCGSCVSMNRQYIPADGEVIVSTANRNFQGRLGNKHADIYIASPATVAASAAAGRLVGAAHPQSVKASA